MNVYKLRKEKEHLIRKNLCLRQKNEDLSELNEALEEDKTKMIQELRMIKDHIQSIILQFDDQLPF